MSDSEDSEELPDIDGVFEIGKETLRHVHNCVENASPIRASSPAPVRASSPAPIRASSPTPVRASSPAPIRASSPAPIRTSSPAPIPPPDVKFFIQDDDSSDDGSDLEADVVHLSRTGSEDKPINAGTRALEEVTLSDDDGPTDTDNTINSPQSLASARYGLRKRKSDVNYSDVEWGTGDGYPKQLKLLPVSTEGKLFDIVKRIKSLGKYTRNPILMDEFNTWSLELTPASLNLLNANWTGLTKFFSSCSNQLEVFQVSLMGVDVDGFAKSLQVLLEKGSVLLQIEVKYDSRDNLRSWLRILQNCIAKGHLKSVKALTVASVAGDISLRSEDFQGIMDINGRFEYVELGDSLWEDIRPDQFEKFLEQQQSSLVSLTIHGGFKGDTNKSRFVVNFPKMPNLQSLSICPKYGFMSEIKNPVSKRTRIIRLDRDVEEPFKFSIHFTADMPKLDKLCLGNLVEMEELPFAIVRRLRVFRCGSNWNLAIRFPMENSRQAATGSNITDLQLPDALKDPLFTQMVGKYFPNVKRVWIYLPSVPVLRAFFKTMENSGLEELHLKTQFDFESTMESCLLPHVNYERGPLTEMQITTLREYKHFDDYVRYHNVELPIQPGDLMEGNSAGIRALKSLKALVLEHIPRILLIPNPEEERKWFDHNCKFLNTTFGYEEYPFSDKCYREILSLKLDHYSWANMRISHSSSQRLNADAGYVTVDDGAGVLNLSSDDEDLFSPISRNIVTRKRKDKSIKVAIQPSMLLPDYFKAKQES